MRNIKTMYIKRAILIFFLLIPLGTFSITDTTSISNKIKQISHNLKLIEENQGSNNDSILNLAKQTLQLSKEINYNEGVYLSYYYLGQIWRLRNYNDSAIYYYKKGLENPISDKKKLEDYYMQLSNVERITGNYSASLENALKLRDLVENNPNSQYNYQIYNLLALSYQTLMEYDLAKKNFEKSATLALEENNEAYAGVVYSNIGKLLYDQNKFDDALQYFGKGTQLEEKHNLRSSLANSYVIIAQILTKKNMIDSARYYLFHATDLYKETNDRIGLTNTLMSVSNYYFTTKDYTNALFHLNLTTKNAKKYKLKRVLSDAYKLKADIYAHQNNFKKAYENFELFYKTHNEIFDFQKINKAKSLEYQLIEKERENDLYELKLDKQKTINRLTIIIASLIFMVGIFILIYLLQIKKLNKELIRSKTKAEESDKLKSKFLQTISHEIRTPLNGIVGFSEMIRSKELSERELKQVNEMINKNSDDLISTIENLVDIAHLSTNQYNVKKSAFKITPLLDHIIEKAKESPVFKLKSDLTLKLEKNGEIEIYSDKDILSKIILHLIKNALLYTEKGSVIVGYKQENTNIILFVKDTGIGIPQEKIDVIFTPFTHANEDIRIKVGGTGLGLTIVTRLIQIINGEIWVDSEIGKGSTFYFKIPRSDK